jgi:general secretion pathway protein H
MFSASAKRGFTLIEMMAVMSIVAMVSALVIVSIPGTGRAGLKAVAMEAASLLRRERQGAMLAGADRRVALDGVRRALVGDGGDAVAIPGDVVVNILGVGAEASEDVPLVLFHADGGSSGAALRFSREGAEYEVRVNWYTGGVSIQAE